MQAIRELAEAIRNLRIYVVNVANQSDGSMDMSLVATWVGIGVSIVALFISIWVPWLIAKKQNKIALFEKRIDTYMKLEKCFQQRTPFSFVIANRAYHAKNKSNLNPFKGENESLVFTTYMLFPATKSILEELGKIYQEITEIDSQISDGLDYLMMSNETRYKRILELYEMEAMFDVGDTVINELREISDTYYRIPSKNDCDDWDYAPCNLYELTEKQSDLMKKAKELEKSTLAMLEKEMQIK